MSSERAGDVEPTDERVLNAMLVLREPSSVASIAGEASSWNRQDEVAIVVGDVVGSWARDLLSLAFDEIRGYGGNSIQVCRRLLAALEDSSKQPRRAGTPSSRSTWRDSRLKRSGHSRRTPRNGRRRRSQTGRALASPATSTRDADVGAVARVPTAIRRWLSGRPPAVPALA